MVIIASKGGYPKHPAWYHNLMANPDTTVQVGSERRRVHARLAEPEERERLWPLAVEGLERLRRLPGTQQGPRNPAGHPRAALGSACSSATGSPPSPAIASGGQGPAQLSRAPSIVIVVPEKKSPAGEAR